MSQLMALSTFLFDRPVLDKKLGEKLVGSWIWPVIRRRETLCILDKLYHEIDAAPRTGSITLSAEARGELLALVLEGPFLRSDLRLQVSKEIYSFDAAGRGGIAVVKESLPQRAVGDIWRYADLRGAYTTVRGDEEELGEPPNSTPPCEKPGFCSSQIPFIPRVPGPAPHRQLPVSSL